MILGFYLFFIVFEFIIPRKKIGFLKRGFWLDLLLYNFLQGFALSILVFQFIDNFYAHYKWHLISSLPVIGQVVILVLLIEFIAYWIHVLNHHWWPMWRVHEVHHTSLELNWLSASRIHFLEAILIRVIGGALLAILGASETSLFVFGTFDTAMGMFIHSNMNVNIGSLKYLFNSPQMHSIHHSTQLKYQQSNYGDKLTIFDWLFGTAIHLSPQELEKLEYGIGYSYPQQPIGQYFYMFRKKSKEDKIISGEQNLKDDTLLPPEKRLDIVNLPNKEKYS